MIILLASDICREIIKEQSLPILQQLQAWSANSDELMISSITYAELIAGSLLTQNREKHMDLVQAFCERLDDIVPWDSGAVDCYTSIQLQAMQDKTVLNMNDAMIAAHALSIGAELLTLSQSSYSNIEGLTLKSINLS